MRMIDSHMHLGLAGYDTGAILRNMDRKGIEMSWLLTWEEVDPPLKELHIGLPPGPALEACLKYPDRFVPFYAPDPAVPDPEKVMKQYAAQGIRGCGELKVSLRWEDPLIERYLEIVQDHGYPLVFHMEKPRYQYIQPKEGFFQWMLERLLNDKFNGVSRYYLNRLAETTGILKKRIERNRAYFPGILFDFAFLEKRVARFPGVRFIGHGPDFWNHISDTLDPRYIHQKGPVRQFGIIDHLLETYPNFYCDISGVSGFNALDRDHGMAGSFLRKHADKILYGTDNTGLPLLELLHSLKPGKEKMARILYGNAIRMLE
jgi:predicted TIM-barrel fold metal-dependent hydrolase